MQGLQSFIPTEEKIHYLNTLLQAGFDVLDFGSFVSPKAVPQMADTAEVLAGLEVSRSPTQLLAIVLNERGARDALSHPAIATLGYPYSISETFQERNAGKSIQQSFEILQRIAELAQRAGRNLRVYISMGFGNPYGDPWNAELVAEAVQKIARLGVREFALADTAAVATPDSVESIFRSLRSNFDDLDIGAHFHVHPSNWESIVAAAWAGGCRRFDTAMLGYGGCPFAKAELTGNLATEHLLDWLRTQEAVTSTDPFGVENAQSVAQNLFARH